MLARAEVPTVRSGFGRRTAVFRREMRAGLGGWLAWTVPISLLVLMTMAVYPSVSESSQALDEMLKSLPPQLRSAFNLDRLSLTDPMGYFGARAYPLVVLFGSIYTALLAGTILAKEEGERTVEFLLGKPVSRTAVVINKAAAVFAKVVLFDLVAGATSYASFEAFAGSEYRLPDLMNLIAGLAAIHLAFSGLGLFASACLSKVRTASSLALGGVLGAYFLDIFAGLSERFEWVGYLSPFQYADAGDILLDGGLAGTDVTVLLAIAVAGVALGHAVYKRKDIHA